MTQPFTAAPTRRSARATLRPDGSGNRARATYSPMRCWLVGERGPIRPVFNIPHTSPATPTAGCTWPTARPACSFDGHGKFGRSGSHARPSVLPDRRDAALLGEIGGGVAHAAHAEIGRREHLRRQASCSRGWGIGGGARGGQFHLAARLASTRARHTGEVRSPTGPPRPDSTRLRSLQKSSKCAEPLPPVASPSEPALLVVACPARAHAVRLAGIDQSSSSTRKLRLRRSLRQIPGANGIDAPARPR